MTTIYVYDLLNRVEIYRGTSMPEALWAEYDYMNFMGLHKETEVVRIEVIS